jgi:hypothetical protein
MIVEFVQQSDRNSGHSGANTARLVNLYPEPLPPGGRAPFQLRGVLGTAGWAEVGGVFMRALADVGGRCFAVANSRLQEIAADGSVTDHGAVGDAVETTISGNDGKVTVVSDGAYFVWDGATLTEPTAGAFSDMGSVDLLGGYTLISELDGNRLQWSDLYDAETLPGLNFYTVEERPGNLVRVFTVNDTAICFKSLSLAVYGRTGQAGAAAIAPLGIVRDIGLKSFNLVARYPDGAFFVGSDNRVYLTDGGSFQAISTPAVEHDIARGTATNCFFYSDEGHQFAVIRFSDRPAWACDLAFGAAWHERATGTGPWNVQQSAFAHGAWRVGGQGGGIHTLTRNSTDVSGPLIREATSLTAYEGRAFTLSRLELFGAMGEYAVEPQLSLWLSPDNGNTWGKERTRGLGGLGEYQTRVNFKALGQFRQVTARVRVTAPYDVRLLSAANVEAV